MKNIKTFEEFVNEDYILVNEGFSNSEKDMLEPVIDDIQGYVGESLTEANSYKDLERFIKIDIESGDSKSEIIDKWASEYPSNRLNHWLKQHYDRIRKESVNEVKKEKSLKDSTQKELELYAINLKTDIAEDDEPKNKEFFKKELAAVDRELEIRKLNEKFLTEQNKNKMKHIKSFDQFINESVNEADAKAEAEETLQRMKDKLKFAQGKRSNAMHPFDPQKKMKDYVNQLKNYNIPYWEKEVAKLSESVTEAQVSKFKKGETVIDKRQKFAGKVMNNIPNKLGYITINRAGKYEDVHIDDAIPYTVKDMNTVHKESVNEGGYDPIDHEIVMSVLDVAAMYTSDANPAANQQWSSIADLAKYIKGDHIPKKYWKSFDASVEQIKKRHNIKESVNEGKVMSKKDIQNLLKTLGGESEDDSAAWDIADGILYDTPGLEAGIKKHFGSRDPQGWLANYI